LRHRCRTVYCIDASGDSPPFATTLAEAITLAYEELGVRITLRDPAGLVPGSAAPLSPPEVLERLNARLSRTAVALGDIEYPEPFAVTEGEPPSRNGTLIVAKALLTPDMPYELLTYALRETAFPPPEHRRPVLRPRPVRRLPRPRPPHRHRRPGGLQAPD